MATSAVQQSEWSDPFLLPEAVLINSSFFVKESYKDKDTGAMSTPSYKCQVAIDFAALNAKTEGGESILDKCFRFCEEKYGSAIYMDVDLADQDGASLKSNKMVITPFNDGDRIAADREARGKKGDLYKGKIIISANTFFNGDGVNGEGGIQVYGEDAKRITAANQGLIYRGCKGFVGVTLSDYKTNRGEPAFKFYLSAFQRSDPGERIAGGRDHSSLFKPMANKGGAAAGGGGAVRGRRAG